MVRDALTTMQAAFATHAPAWTAAIKALAEVDCLASLALSRSMLGSPCCRPKFIESKVPVLESTGLRHPVLPPHPTLYGVFLVRLYGVPLVRLRS